MASVAVKTLAMKPFDAFYQTASMPVAVPNSQPARQFIVTIGRQDIFKKM